jgi:hypothetical protein
MSTLLSDEKNRNYIYIFNGDEGVGTLGRAAVGGGVLARGGTEETCRPTGVEIRA